MKVLAIPKMLQMREDIAGLQTGKAGNPIQSIW